jgi:hypothetical protein
MGLVLRTPAERTATGCNGLITSIVRPRAVYERCTCGLFRPRLRWGDRELESLGATDGGERFLRTDAVLGQEPRQVVDAAWRY